MSEPVEGPNPRANEEGYLLFAEQYAKWTQKAPVKGLRDLLAGEYPEATQIERDGLALQFLIFEMMRYTIPNPEDDEGKEPWQI